MLFVLNKKNKHNEKLNNILLMRYLILQTLPWPDTLWLNKVHNFFYKHLQRDIV